MELHLDTGNGQYSIRGYGNDFIQVNDKKIKHSLIVTPNECIAWPPHSIAELTPAHFLPLFSLQPNIVLLGTGQQLIFPKVHLLAEFYKRNMGIEIMNTAAACRTFSLLMAEGRKVAAALMIT